MRIIDGMKLPGRRVEIPDCSRDDLPEFFREMSYSVGAEIGVDCGLFSEVLCRGGMKLYSIDPWVKSDEYFEPQEKMEDNYEIAKKRLSEYDCTIMRMTSMNALKHFNDNSLDFVYIDGNHSFVYVAQDIYYWAKKVKPGGIVAGHDYYYHQSTNPFKMNVRHVVDTYASIVNVKLYILGRKDRIKGEKRDTYRSWMFIK